MTKKEIINLLDKKVKYYLDISNYYYKLYLQNNDQDYHKLSNDHYNIYCLLDSILQQAKQK